MIKANGSPLSWLRYDFATRDFDGTVWAWGTYEDAQTEAEMSPGTVVVMRAVYATGWTETL